MLTTVLRQVEGTTELLQGLNDWDVTQPHMWSSTGIPPLTDILKMFLVNTVLYVTKKEQKVIFSLRL